MAFNQNAPGATPSLPPNMLQDSMKAKSPGVAAMARRSANLMNPNQSKGK